MVICLERGADLHMAQVVLEKSPLNGCKKMVVVPLKSVGIRMPFQRREPLKSVTHGHYDARPTVTFPAAGHHRPLP